MSGQMIGDKNQPQTSACQGGAETTGVSAAVCCADIYFYIPYAHAHLAVQVHYGSRSYAMR